MAVLRLHPIQDTNRGLLQRCHDAEAESGRTGTIIESLEHQKVCGSTPPPPNPTRAGNLEQVFRGAISVGWHQSHFEELLDYY